MLGFSEADSTTCTVIDVVKPLLHIVWDRTAIDCVHQPHSHTPHSRGLSVWAFGCSMGRVGDLWVYIEVVLNVYTMYVLQADKGFCVVCVY